MLIRKFFHEKFNDFKEDEYFIERDKRKPYTDLMGACCAFFEIMRKEGLFERDEGSNTLTISFKSKAYLTRFLDETSNDYSMFLKSILISGNNTPLSALKAATYNFLIFRKCTHKNYVISSTLCDILQAVNPLKELPLLTHNFLAKENKLCLDLTRLKSVYFKNINAYAYYAANTNVVVVSFYGEISDDRHSSVFFASTRISKDKDLLDSDLFTLVPDYFIDKYSTTGDFQYQHKMSKDFCAEYVRIINTVLNCILFISNPSKNSIIQEKIAEISAKRSKRDYQLKHYSDSDYVEIDISVEKVRAYEQGKTWYKKAHPRWQRCGKGYSEVKLIFLAPQFPERKKLY